MIDTLYEMLALDHKSEAWFIFGINTTKQKLDIGRINKTKEE